MGLELVEIMLDVEEEFCITIPDDSDFKTVGGSG